MPSMKWVQNQPWPEEDIQRLRDLRFAGKGPTEIAEILHRTTSAVGAKIRSLKLPNMPIKPAPPSGPLESRRRHDQPSEPRRAGKSTLPPLASLQDT